MTALVTGASSGLGRALARELMAQGWEVLAAGRREQELAALGARAWYAVDLSAPEGVEELYRRVAEDGFQVDLLVCCAGMGYAGPFLDHPQGDLEALLGVNITALTTLDHLVLRDMTTRGQGRVLNIASTGSWQPGPYMAAYYASKAYVLSLSRAVRRELRGTGVTVTAACPGAVASDFSRRAGRRDPKNAMAPEKAAKVILRGALKGKSIVVPGFVNKCGHVAAKLLPSAWMAEGVFRYQKKLIG